MVDSVYLDMQYVNNNPDQNYIDSMVVEITIAKRGDNTHGTIGVVYQPDFYFSTTVADSAPRYTTFIYDPATGGMSDSVTQVKRRIAVMLDPATDTARGLYAFGIDPITVPEGYKTIMFAHFVTGNQYALGTDETAANYLNLFSSEPGGSGTSSRQSIGSYQAGEVAFTDNTYPSSDGYTIGGHNVPLACFLFGPAGSASSTTNASFENPDMAIHILCCGTTSVANVRAINSVNAYPSPANDVVTVSFALTSAANTTVTLSNTIGQVVKTQSLGTVTNAKAIFSTSDLAAGVYFYTVNANGQKTTNRIVIAH